MSYCHFLSITNILFCVTILKDYVMFYCHYWSFKNVLFWFLWYSYTIAESLAQSTMEDLKSNKDVLHNLKEVRNGFLTITLCFVFLILLLITMLCYPMSCHAMLCHDISCYDMLYQIKLCHIMLKSHFTSSNLSIFNFMFSLRIRCSVSSSLFYLDWRTATLLPPPLHYLQNNHFFSFLLCRVWQKIWKL